MEFPNDLDVTIKPEHFKKAGGYSRRFNCPLFNALQDMYPNIPIGVGYSEVYIGSQYATGPTAVYRISTEEWGGIGNPSGYDPTDIDDLCDKAKMSLEGIPTVDISLIKIG